jgi:hypothetical protein
MFLMVFPVVITLIMKHLSNSIHSDFFTITCAEDSGGALDSSVNRSDGRMMHLLRSVKEQVLDLTKACNFILGL